MGLVSGITNALGLTGQQTPNFIQPDKINNFSSPFGTATDTGYTASASPNQANADAARAGLSNVLSSGLQASPDRLQAFQDARNQEMLTPFNQQQALREKQQAISSATRGTAGSSADLYRQSLLEQQGTQGRNTILNQAIQGKEQLANQLFNQNAASAGLYQGIAQQDFNNQLAGFGATQGALQGSQGNALNYANSLNQLENARTQAANDARTAGMRNLIGLGATGLGIYNAFGNN